MTRGLENDKCHNIAIINHHAATPRVGGGGRHYQLGDLLSEAGHNVCVLTSSYSPRKKRHHYRENVFVETIKSNFDYIWLKTYPCYRNTLGRFANYTHFMLKAGEPKNLKIIPDVVIASSVHPLAWSAGYKLSKIYGAKFIVEVRDLWPLSMYEDFTGITRNAIFAFFEYFEKKYYVLADKIITTAPFAFEYIEEKYGVNRNKIVHIPHGIDLEKYDQSLNGAQQVISDELEETLERYFCVTYTGTLSKSEGLGTLIESAKYLSGTVDIRIVLIGSGNQKTMLEDIIRREKLQNVILFDRIPREAVPLVLSKSDVLFAGLMEREAFKYGISKNKFYDYMASGKPIVFASNVRGSLITEAKAGITIKPGDPKKLAETILYIYNNMSTIGKEYGENGRKFVEQYHTVQVIAEKFLEVIDHC